MLFGVGRNGPTNAPMKSFSRPVRLGMVVVPAKASRPVFSADTGPSNDRGKSTGVDVLRSAAVTGMPNSESCLTRIVPWRSLGSRGCRR
jgi:hypothetical protein